MHAWFIMNGLTYSHPWPLRCMAQWRHRLLMRRRIQQRCFVAVGTSRNHRMICVSVDGDAAVASRVDSTSTFVLYSNTSSAVSHNIHFPKTQGTLPLVGYTSVTRRLHVGWTSVYVGYRRNGYRRNGHTSVTRPLHVRYVGYDLNILAAWVFGKWTLWDTALDVQWYRTS